MIIVDSHLDLGWNAVQWDRDLEKTVPQIRAAEKGMNGKGRGLNTVALPELRKGKFALVFATTVSRCTGRAFDGVDYRSQTACYAAARSQFVSYRLWEKRGFVRIITDRKSLAAHMAKWRKGTKAPIGFILAMESADPIPSPKDLRDWWDLGVRCIGPAHYGPGRYAHGTGSKGGLTKIGREIVRGMDKLGIILDLTHLDDPAFWQSLEIYDGPVLASHNNCRALVPAQRQFSDEQIRAIIHRNGVIGAAFDNWMLYPNFRMGETPNTCASIATVVDHIDHICQLAGNANHTGIGSDLDGGYGTEQSPHDLDTITDIQKVAGILRKRGYKEADVENIMHGNWVRLLQRALPPV